jgi:hypothetical protein
VRKLAIAAALALTICGGAAVAQNAAPPAGSPPEQPAPDPEPAIPAGLRDLEKTTFACPKAALNAAAREVAKYKSEGTYQFSYFNIVSASHHAAYEVHFTSNYVAEPVLKFCVAIYCQQGFDPATTKTSVALMGTKAAAHASSAGHAANACSPRRTPARRRTMR